MENTILIIEDDPFLLNIYRTKMVKEGFTVRVAENGELGLASMREVAPQLVLLDIIMPKLDGFGVLETMQQEDALKEIPVIMLTNLGQDADVKRAKALGAKDYVVKSDTTLKTVVNKVRTYLS